MLLIHLLQVYENITETAKFDDVIALLIAFVLNQILHCGGLSQQDRVVASCERMPKYVNTDGQGKITIHQL